MKIRFEFRKARGQRTRLAGTPDAKPTHDGTVAVILTINKIKYGPYATTMQCFRSVWDGRKAKRVSEDSQLLIQRIASYQTHLETAYTELVRLGEVIDGQAVMNALKQPTAANGQVVTLLAVYEEFMKASKASIQQNRQKRQYDQISETTFKTYPKRWAMISRFLQNSKRNQLPINAVNYAFTARLKEYLVSYNKGTKPAYSSSTINKGISFLKMLMTYAQSKEYVPGNPITTFACRGGSAANPKPLTLAQLDLLETCDLPAKLRHICDSWLIAGELCLHYSNYIQLPRMSFITRPDGRRYIQHERSKQQGSNLKQTVDVTPTAERLLAKYGGPRGLFYKHTSQFSTALEQISMHADLVNDHGIPIMLQFGQGRDSGLTSRARQGANGIQLSKMAGWSNPRVANRYLGDDIGIVEGFVCNQK